MSAMSRSGTDGDGFRRGGQSFCGAIAEVRRALGHFWKIRSEAVSDSGSGMGAAGGCQVRAEAVTVPGWIPLTCGNVQQQRS